MSGKLMWVSPKGLMCLFPPDLHPHGIDESSFAELFTEQKPVVFALYSDRRAIHSILHGRPEPDRFHVRGFIEQGTTTTPFDMVVLNGMSRYHLCLEAVRHAPRIQEHAQLSVTWCKESLERHARYIRENFEDIPEVRDWVWSD